ncbi:hypothetical protein GCM10022217_26230 [Chryseobacterium ginsenosidimutans]|uniref:tail fiber domain-containing protein n=1 Tax=Chryseobacterium ginsenosidimutans TaxID=687846 RepID=UPI0031E21C19
MKKQIYTLAVLLMMGFAAKAQVGIGTPTPNSSSMLDITSTTKGLLMPRMSTGQRTSIASPATGLQVYDTTTNSFWYFNGAVWVNSGAISAQDLRLLTNNNHVTQDAGVGSNGTNLGTGFNNIAIGTGVLNAVTSGGSNVGIGALALTANSLGNYNYAVGESALKANTSGTANVGLGLQSLLANTIGNNNVALGYVALQSNTTGSNNTAVGVQAGNNITTGTNNITIGAATAIATPSASNQLNIANNIFGTGLSGSVTAPAGRIGIGTNNPRSLLHAAIDASTYSGQLVVGGKTIEDKIIEIGYNTTTNQGYIQPSWAGNTWSDLLLNPNNGGQGYVGINSQSPHGQLTLGNLVMNRKIILFETVNNDHQFYGFGINGATLRYQTDGAGSDHVFYSASSPTTSTELARIKGNGNVGIGTSAPITKLNVAANQTNFTNELAQLVVSGIDTTQKLLLGYNTSTDNGYIQAVHSGVNWMNLILQPNAGNVGIGTTTPVATLDVGSKFKFYPTGALAKTDPIMIIGSTTSWSRIGTGGGALGLWGDGNTASNDSPNLFIMTNGNVGIGTTTPSSLLHVNGVITATKIQGPSDFRFKKNIKPIENALDKVVKLGGYTYDWKDASEFPNQSLGKGHDMGVIAQEVEKQFPEAVTTNADGYKAVSYTELVPALIEAVKTLKTEVDELKKEIAKIKK